MTNEQIKEQLRAIINTPAMELTKEQKDFVREQANNFLIPFKTRARCTSCYHDTALKIYNAIVQNEQTIGIEDDGRKYVLKAGVDLYFGNVRVNAATITDELAERILAQGFERKYFVKICE